jgi:hypothetical protein
MTSIQSFGKGADYVVEDDQEILYSYLGAVGHEHPGVVGKVEDKLTGAVFALKNICVKGPFRAERSKFSAQRQQLFAGCKVSLLHII